MLEIQTLKFELKFEHRLLTIRQVYFALVKSARAAFANSAGMPRMLSNAEPA